MRTFGLNLGLLAVLTSSAAAQMHHVDAPERVTRALGVYEWVGDLDKPAAARLVPLTVFINGHTEDAGTYLARPVPFALATGNLYTVESAGIPKGTIDITIARDIASQRSAADDNPMGNWYGYGHFIIPKPPKKSNLKPSVDIPDIASTTDDRPHFVAARPQPTTSETTSKPTMDADDPERPTLGRRDPDAEPEREKKAKKPKAAGYVTGLPNGLNDDPDRPTLGRNKTGQVETPPLTGLPLDMQQAVAISDATSAETHDFSREWENADEHATTLTGMQKLAATAVHEYLAANGLVASRTGELPALTTAPPKPKPAHQTSTRTSRSAKKPEAPPGFAHEQLKGFELSYGGLPTYVYTAEGAATQAKPGTGPLQVQVFATVVAQRLPSGDLQVSLQSVTDGQHLARGPQMRFIDAVDADGSHRASLLFELRAKQSRQFALYRLVTAKADQTFATDPLE